MSPAWHVSRNASKRKTNRNQFYHFRTTLHLNEREVLSNNEHRAQMSSMCHARHVQVMQEQRQVLHTRVSKQAG